MEEVGKEKIRETRKKAEDVPVHSSREANSLARVHAPTLCTETGKSTSYRSKHHHLRQVSRFQNVAGLGEKETQICPSEASPGTPPASTAHPREEYSKDKD